MLLGGGFPLRQISLLYGEASTGKTILSMQCALEMARKDFKVFYVDADQSFSAHRLERMIGGPELAEKIVLFRPEDFKDQVGIVENLENVLTRTPALVIVDSITGLYRAGDGVSEKIFARNREPEQSGSPIYIVGLADWTGSQLPVWRRMAGGAGGDSYSEALV